MKTEGLNPYSEDDQAIIVALLSNVMYGATSEQMLGVLVTEIGKALGRSNYAEIEVLCRSRNIPLSLLAVPSSVIEEGDITKMVVDPNNPSVAKPFFALPFPYRTTNDVDYYATGYGIEDYDPATNLERLKQAGIIGVRLGCEPERIAKAHLN